MIENKEKTISFRTTQAVNDKIEALSDQISQNRWDIGYRSDIAEARTKSGLIHLILSEKADFSKVKLKLAEVDDDMKAKNKLQFDEVAGFTDAEDQDHFVVFGKIKERNKHLILADYHKTAGLTGQFMLKSVLNKDQIAQVREMIQKFHSDAEVKL